MSKSTKRLIAAAAILNALIVIWGFVEPSQRDLRIPLWFALALLIGAVADRFPVDAGGHIAGQQGATRPELGDKIRGLHGVNGQ